MKICFDNGISGIRVHRGKEYYRLINREGESHWIAKSSLNAELVEKYLQEYNQLCSEARSKNDYRELTDVSMEQSEVSQEKPNKSMSIKTYPYNSKMTGVEIYSCDSNLSSIEESDDDKSVVNLCGITVSDLSSSEESIEVKGYKKRSRRRRKIKKTK